MDLTSEFAKRGPWITRFVIDGVESGGKFDASTDPRIDQFFECFPRVRTILDLGSLEGGQTFALARHPGIERILGIEARGANVEKARFVQRLLGIANVEFAVGDLEKADLTLFGKFDAVFCSGLLYHLPAPWQLIEQIPRITPNLFIWTHYADDLQADVTFQEWKGRYHIEGGLAEPLSGMSARSFWLTLGSLIKLLTVSGFETVRIVRNEVKHANGPAVTLAAKTTPSSSSL